MHAHAHLHTDNEETAVALCYTKMRDKERTASMSMRNLMEENYSEEQGPSVVHCLKETKIYFKETKENNQNQ